MLLPPCSCPLVPLLTPPNPAPCAGRMLYDYQTGHESQFYEYDYYIEEAWVSDEC